MRLPTPPPPPGPILGIESSCDETAAAIVAPGGKILSAIVASQLDTHAIYGGVVPELASREHLRAIVPTVRQALHQANLKPKDLAAIAVTEGPGLVGSLLVGITYAKALSAATGLPLIAVNHLEGHIHAAVMDALPAFPVLALIVSGGHTHLFEVAQNWQYRLIGRTRDDAAGEAYDKVAKLLGFPYPGGPLIDQLAPHGDPAPFARTFTAPRTKSNPQDFSFSGWKTAVLYWTQARPHLAPEISARRQLAKQNPTLQQWLQATPQETLNLLAAFQKAVIDDLLRRATRAAQSIHARAMIVTGGVACNAGLRAETARRNLPFPVHFPEPRYSTDNAVMIAAAAFPKFERGEFASTTLKAKANLQLAPAPTT